jgi:hypothetical protein
MAGMILLCLAAACGAPARSPAPTDIGNGTLAWAAAEATAIIERAQATALVLEARAAATALVAQTGAAGITRAPVAPNRASPAAPAAQNRATPAPTGEMTTTGTIEIVRVGFAAEGGFIDVQFIAPPEVAEKWWQGSVYVIDEATGTKYEEIPVMPTLGALIGKPQRAGQAGYVMLVNAPVPLRPGAMVTVVLGDFKQEHVLIK